jgi:isopentenyl phosphate kinase
VEIIAQPFLTPTGEHAKVSTVKLLFLKLGGSLITDKTRSYSPRPDILAELSQQIMSARQVQPDLKLLIGHGSGSFGHTEASKYQTRLSVRDPEGWQGFSEVWFAASALNRLVMDALHNSGLQVMTFPPSSSVTAQDGQVVAWDLSPIQSALDASIIPVVYGDVVFDVVRGGTILSTEDLFGHLAHTFRPQRILLAGLEAGVWSDFPTCSRLIAGITPENIGEQAKSLGGSAGTDVTGGMDSKVHQMLQLVQETPGLDVLIFSGEEPGNIKKALLGNSLGTRIHN